MKKKVVGILFVVLFAFVVTLVSCNKEPVVDNTIGTSSNSKVGTLGPAGGYIFYDCDADNDSGNADRLISSECGWRYLEAAPKDLDGLYPFGYDRTSEKGNNINFDSDTPSVSVGDGKINTEARVEALGETAYIEYEGALKGIYAAKACADYSITVDGVVYSDWFLPSLDELQAIYDVICINKLGSYLEDYSYWSSSCHGYNDAESLYVNGGSSYQHNDPRYNCYRIRPVRAFNPCLENVNHSWDHGVETAATCSSEGIITYTCTICGQTMSQSIASSLPHNWNSGAVTKAATCSGTGVKTYTCLVCEATKTEAIPELGHDYENYRCTRCDSWSKGPTGGYVFYDCDADNVGTSAGEDGLMSSVCGWRYLEAAPSDLEGKYRFGYYRRSATAYEEKVGTDSAIGKGKNNTDALVTAMGDEAYDADINNSSKIMYAAKECADYSITVDGTKYDDWFLPSQNELKLMYQNLCKQNLGSFEKSSKVAYLSSTEKDSGSAYGYCFDKGSLKYFAKGIYHYVRPIRAFK